MEIVGIGLSGGADSAVAAYLLKQNGCQVRGFTMCLFPGSNTEKAAKVAEKLEISLQILPLEKRFEESIISSFVNSYADGFTPSPCVLCNRNFKFGIMQQAILASGCTHMATGHYARLGQAEGGRVRLLRGSDAGKEQSYFLAQLSQQQLAKARFPLGNYRKEDVLQLANSQQLIAPQQGESQDLCFLPDGDFATLVATRRPELCQEGWIVDQNGRKLGKHQGAFRYTRGQRRGLGLGGGPWFVLDVMISENLLIVGTAEKLLSQKVLLTGMNWLRQTPPVGEKLSCIAQVRYRMSPKPAELQNLPDNQAEITFLQAVSAITPGQLAVCYDDQEVIASGWIAKQNSTPDSN
ncbi:MAG: tRNA 2-thiouridine(34) synthase MnmA [Lentisphaeria bacterium]